MQSVEKVIKQKITRVKRGTLLFPKDFDDLGSSEAIRLALYRLEKEHFVKRIAQGIYVRPVINKYIGEVLPSAEEVAEGIAKRDKLRVIPTGSYALNALGLSTQIPMKIVLLTDGAPREIVVGKRTVKFKKTTPKNLMAKGKISGLVIQALREIGIGKVTDDEKKQIIKLLQKEDQKQLKHDLQLAPVWIKKIMEKAITDDTK